MNDKRHGEGIQTYADGTKYEGRWTRDKMNGYEVKSYPNYNCKYEGQLMNGKFHGYGIY